MSKFSTLLNLRLKPKDTLPPKMSALAEMTSNGQLSSFGGIFQISSLTENEKENLSNILNSYKEGEERELQKDLEELIAVTSEVKAITKQAVLLHGERIKKAQDILKKYKEGAFTAWLITTYGNRQTPYNFLQYFEFYSAMPQELHPKLDNMPRQAVYTLASRSGTLENKIDIINSYQGQPKNVILSLIRKAFPLPKDDKRLPNLAEQAIVALRRLKGVMQEELFKPDAEQKNEIYALIIQMHSLIDKKL